KRLTEHFFGVVQMINKMSKIAVLAAACGVMLVSGAVNAAALVNVSVQGSIDNGATWANSLNVTAGQDIEIRLVGQLAAVDTHNNQGAGRTITSEVAGTDGIGSLKFNLVDSSNGTFSQLAL